MNEPLRYTEQDLQLALKAQAEYLRARLKVVKVIVNEGDQYGAWQRDGAIISIVETAEGQVVCVA